MEEKAINQNKKSTQRLLKTRRIGVIKPGQIFVVPGTENKLKLNRANSE